MRKVTLKVTLGVTCMQEPPTLACLLLDLTLGWVKAEEDTGCTFVFGYSSICEHVLALSPVMGSNLLGLEISYAGFICFSCVPSGYSSFLPHRWLHNNMIFFYLFD